MEITTKEQLKSTPDNRKKVISEFGRWCDAMADECPVICLSALNLLNEQEAVPLKEDKINKCECGETVCRYWHPKFCGFCGRELLWY